MAPQLEAHVEANPSTRLLKIDIDNWDSPVSEQFDLKSLPHVLVYEGKELVAPNTKQALELLKL